MAGPVGLSPTAWYDPSNASGTTLSGSDVTNLVDLSGNGSDTPGPGGGNNPTLTATIFTHNAIAFNGTNQYLGSGPLYANLFNSTTYTVAGVGRFNTVATDSGTFDNNDCLFSDIGADLNLYARSSNLMGLGQWDGARQSTEVAYTVGTTFVFIAWKEAGTMNLTVNGVSNDKAAGALSGGNLVFGRVSSSSTYSDLSMGEWLSFNTALSSSDRSALYAYLLNKWTPQAITIDPAPLVLTGKTFYQPTVTAPLPVSWSGQRYMLQAAPPQFPTTGRRSTSGSPALLVTWSVVEA